MIKSFSFAFFFSFDSTFYEPSTILGFVWNPKGIKERKNIMKNDFLVFGFKVKNIILKILHIFLGFILQVESQTNKIEYFINLHKQMGNIFLES